MAKLFYSYRDGQVYMLHKYCPLELLMDKQISGGNGLLIYASEEAFEIVEYMHGKESGYAVEVRPRTAEPLLGIILKKVGEK